MLGVPIRGQPARLPAKALGSRRPGRVQHAARPAQAAHGGETVAAEAKQVAPHTSTHTNTYRLLPGAAACPASGAPCPRGPGATGRPASRASSCTAPARLRYGRCGACGGERYGWRGTPPGKRHPAPGKQKAKRYKRHARCQLSPVSASSAAPAQQPRSPVSFIVSRTTLPFSSSTTITCRGGRGRGERQQAGSRAPHHLTTWSHMAPWRLNEPPPATRIAEQAHASSGSSQPLWATASHPRHHHTRPHLLGLGHARDHERPQLAERLLVEHLARHAAAGGSRRGAAAKGKLLREAGGGAEVGEDR